MLLRYLLSPRLVNTQQLPSQSITSLNAVGMAECVGLVSQGLISRHSILADRLEKNDR